MKRAITQANNYAPSEMAFSLKTLQEASTLLSVFENSQRLYKQSYREQVKASKSLQDLMKKAKLYISHFIQVFNLAVLRGEIKVDCKSLYGIAPDDFNVPDMVSDAGVMEWGEKVINGEQERLATGGSPIYNPAIAKVKVHFDMFKEAYFQQKIYQKNTTRTLDNLASLRGSMDAVILEVWNQVEDKFRDGNEHSLEKCREYGLVYYYRKGEQMNVFD